MNFSIAMHDPTYQLQATVNGDKIPDTFFVITQRNDYPKNTEDMKKIIGHQVKNSPIIVRKNPVATQTVIPSDLPPSIWNTHKNSEDLYIGLTQFKKHDLSPFINRLSKKEKLTGDPISERRETTLESLGVNTTAYPAEASTTFFASKCGRSTIEFIADAHMRNFHRQSSTETNQNYICGNCHALQQASSCTDSNRHHLTFISRLFTNVVKSKIEEVRSKWNQGKSKLSPDALTAKEYSY